MVFLLFASKGRTSGILPDMVLSTATAPCGSHVHSQDAFSKKGMSPSVCVPKMEEKIPLWKQYLVKFRHQNFEEPKLKKVQDKTEHPLETKGC